MTICIVVKCIDGAVVASDSQSEFGRGVGVKRLNANKIYCVDDKYVLAGAGVVAQIMEEVKNIEFALKLQESTQRSELNEAECNEVIWRTLLALHGKYNIERGRVLGIDQPDFFDPLLIFAGRAGIEGKVGHVFSTLILHPDGLVEPIDDYGTVGSGAAYAELLLKNIYREGIKTDEASKLSAYVVGEVKSIDPGCGGSTNVAILTKDSVELLPQDEVERLYEEMKNQLKPTWNKLGRMRKQ